MRYCRYSSPEGVKFGLVEHLDGTPQITNLLPETEDGLPDLHHPKRIAAQPLASVQLLAPVRPSKIICVGRNYLDHAKELGNDAPKEPLIFFKPPSSVIATDEKIVRPRVSERIDFEGELAVVIKKSCRNVAADQDVRPYILGYTCANDVTARDLQKTDGQWTRAKGFDTFCPVGPLVTDEIDPWQGVSLETRVNGTVKQAGNTRDFIFTLDVVIRYVSRIMTLLPGDLICTGTPAGVGPLVAGDSVTVSVQGIGTLKNPVSDGD
ncbi:MAG TPA: fumarylacetoacetate hydrolase family protein [Candidatus Angelobacter sp.]|jgi:2-keto-4-pentenoate hydratase/2-oxohepta-3-ene-1,7-dioic acid hydratase in catechol pathway|nr:fumarylacetoacetate hydrolase family protein [Candidatus Angelobacter sp.]